MRESSTAKEAAYDFLAGDYLLNNFVQFVVQRFLVPNLEENLEKDNR